jgi:hypothetical protein
MKPGDNPLSELLTLVCDQRSEPAAVRSMGEDYPGDAGTATARDLTRRYYRRTVTLSRWSRGYSPCGALCWVAQVMSAHTSTGGRP